MMLRPALLLLACWLAGCAGLATTPAAPPAEALLFHDQAFAPPPRPVDAGEVFALSDGMRQLLASTPARSVRNEDPRSQLIDRLFGTRKVMLEYDASVTRNAADAFERRSGNCLSLVIMTAAFAKAAGLPVEYRHVLVDESWSRSNGLYFASHHVNLALGWPMGRTRQERELDEQLVIDFLPQTELRGVRSRPISEARVVAMFMNNRAAEAMARDALDEAYWWVREAVRQDRQFLSAVNTLGVLYMRRGELRWAQQAFAAVLEREPDNTKVLGNMANALVADGRADEAAPLLARLAALEPVAPYAFFNAGLDAMRAQDWPRARELFRKEEKRQAYNAELHFWLAQAAWRLGDLRDADRHLELARENSTTPQEHALYAGKLGWLRAQRVNRIN